jgi:drug/metabolite transporter (DMT)-like permease
MSAGLPPLAVAVVLAAALLHAAWNVLLARVPRGPDATAVGLALGLVAWTPVAVVRWRVDAEVWPYVLGSAVFELAYFAALNLAYSRAPAHAAYAVARGLAPALLLLPVAALGVPASAWVGVLAISAGVLLTTWGEANRGAIYAVPVAVCIASYTFLDSHGVRYADPATYLWLTMCPVVVVLLATRLVRRRGLDRARAQLRPWTCAFGIGVFAAYGLTLAALAMVSTAQVPAVAALRETSILFMLGLSWLASDHSGRPSAGGAAGAVFVFSGVALLTLG